MNREELIKKINTFFIDDFDVAEATITPNADIKELLHLDSLDYITLVVSIEKNFGFKAKLEDLRHVQIVSDLYDYIEKFHVLGEIIKS